MGELVGVVMEKFGRSCRVYLCKIDDYIVESIEEVFESKKKFNDWNKNGIKCCKIYRKQVLDYYGEV